MELKIDKLSSTLIQIRDTKGYSQAYVAEKIGLSQKAYNYIESGKCRMELFRFLKITHVMKTHPMEILNKLVCEKASWKTQSEICFNQKDCRLQKEVEDLRTENKLLRAALDRFLFSEK